MRSPDDVLLNVASVRVGEAKNAETLQPAVVVYLTLEGDVAGEVCFAMPPDLADLLGNELWRWAARARGRETE